MEQHLVKTLSNLIIQGDLAKAINILESSKTKYNSDAQYWEFLTLTQGMSGNNLECINACTQAIKFNPDNIGTYINLGVAQQNLGLLDKAEESLTKALSINDTHPQVQNNLGALYILRSEYIKAKSYIDKAISIKPDFSDAHSNLGEIYKHLQANEKATECYLKAIALNPNSINAYIGLGSILSSMAAYEKGEFYLKKALKLNPYHPEALFNLGFLHYLKKSYGTASVFFKDTLQINPDHQNARYLLSAITGNDAPDQSPQQYVKSLFNHYAETFDDHLVNALGYDAPNAMHQIVTKYANPVNTRHLLDLGCGTGMCGEVFRAQYDHLTGVDLSEKMIRKSEEKRVYDELYNNDLTIFLEKNHVKYDMIVAADVFIYIGDLAKIVNATVNAQEKGGYFIFSIEKSFEHQTYHLRDTGRYSHSVNYIKNILNEASYNIILDQPTILRNEKGHNIEGIIYLCQKP